MVDLDVTLVSGVLVQKGGFKTCFATAANVSYLVCA